MNRRIAGRAYGLPRLVSTGAAASTADSPYPEGLLSGSWALTRGQLDCDLDGELRNAGNAAAQNDATIINGLRTLDELGHRPEDFVRAVVFFDQRASRKELLEGLSRHFGEIPPTIVTVPIPGFPLPGMMVESDFFSSKDQPRQAVIERNDGMVSTGALASGEYVFLATQAALGPDGQSLYPGDFDAQLGWLEDRIGTLLGELGSEMDDLIRLGTYFVATEEEDRWRMLVESRARWFRSTRPVVTDITLDRLQPEGVLVTMDGLAVRRSNGEISRRQELAVGGLGCWPFDARHPPAIMHDKRLFVGGRSAMTRNGKALEPGVVEYQTRHCMEEISALLKAAGMSFPNVAKANAYFPGVVGRIDSINRNFPIRASYYRFPGPASTGVYVTRLPLPGTMISVEVMADSHA